jgi:hypothetical protein
MIMTDYRKRAEECMEIAQAARTPEQRIMLLHIAETWLNLAKHAEVNAAGATQKSSNAPTLN